jgi:hypothetical protein
LMVDKSWILSFDPKLMQEIWVTPPPINIKEGLEVLIVVVMFCLLGHNAVYSVENQPMFCRNMSPLSSESKNKQRNKPAWSR